MITIWAVHPHQLIRTAIAWLLPPVVAALQWWLWPHIAPSPYFLFFPVVLFAPLIGGLWGGVGATLLSAVLAWYLFLPPELSWQIHKVGSAVSLLIFVATGLGMAWSIQRLRASEDKYRTLFDRAGEGIVIVNRQRRVVDANPAMCALVGVPRAEFKGRHMEDFIADYTPQNWAEVDAAIEAQGETTVERHLQRPDGSLHAVEAVVTHLPGREHLAFVHSIQERQQLEHALRVGEERLRHALEASNEGIWEWNLATGEAYANDLWFTQLGYASDEVTPSDDLWRQSIHPADTATAQQTIDDYLFGRRRDSLCEYRVVTKGGAIRWLRSVGKIVARSADGSPIRMVGTNTDITAAKLGEQKLRDSEERFRLVVANSPNTIVIWDETAAPRYVSPAIVQALGYTPEEMLSYAATFHSHVADLTDAEVTPGRLAAVEAATLPGMRTWLSVFRTVQYCIQHPGQTVQTEERLPTRTGERRDLLLISQGFARSGSGCEVVTIIHDITEHRMYERMLQEANARLEQQVTTRTAELEASVAELRRAHAGKDAFMAAISHELRTPLTGILSMTELLQSQERGPLNEEQAQYIATLLASGQRLLATVNSVLLYTNLVSGASPLLFETCRVADLCVIAARTAKPLAAAKQQQFVQALDPATPDIESDPQGIVQIVKELLTNAVKFTPAGGRVELSVAPAAHSQAVDIAVADTGIGLTAEQLATIFHPFTQGDQTLARRFEGIGLGLAYVHEMVQRLGGTVAVTSAPGNGSCFAITLPLHKTATTPVVDNPSVAVLR